MIDYPHEWDLDQKLRLAHSLFLMGSDTNSNFLAFIGKELDRLDRLNRKEADDILFRQRQGVCQVLDKLLELIENSSEMHRTLKASEDAAVNQIHRINHPELYA